MLTRNTCATLLDERNNCVRGKMFLNREAMADIAVYVQASILL